MKKLTIIIPVFNEEKTIDTLLNRVYSMELPDWKKEILVIDDGSTDKTRALLKKWEKKSLLSIKRKMKEREVQ